MITFSSTPQMVSDKLPEIFSAFNRPVISQKQVSQKDKDTDVAVLNKKGNNIDADTQHTKPIISQPKKKLGFWKNLGAATVGYFGMKIPANIPAIKVFLSFFASLISSFSNIKITGIKDTAPIIKRIPLNENAPRCSEPYLCATNANPHIIAVKIKSNVDFIFFKLTHPYYVINDAIITHFVFVFNIFFYIDITMS